MKYRLKYRIKTMIDRRRDIRAVQNREAKKSLARPLLDTCKRNFVNGANIDSSLILGCETITYHSVSLASEELVGRSVLYVYYEPDQEIVQRKITICLNNMVRQ